ncbi:MAG TPA: hypothetical protein VIM65_12385 [Cyclobacteriaceae bacterium]
MGSLSQKTDTKVLSIDFDLHTDGDEEFKRELIALMIDNIRELRGTLERSLKLNDMHSFHVCSHKVAPTLGILNDQEFLDIIEMIKHQTDLSKLEYSVELFNRNCEELIYILKKEAVNGH